MRRGSECGLWRALRRSWGACGWASWPRIPATCVSAHVPVHSKGGEGGTDREGPWRRERKGGTLATAQRLAAQAHDAEREEGRARAKQLAPTGRPQRAEGKRDRARERKLPLTGGARLSGGVGARVRGLAGPSWAAFPFFFFSRFYNSFSISFQ
jgi:hypothetical protein